MYISPGIKALYQVFSKTGCETGANLHEILAIQNSLKVLIDLRVLGIQGQSPLYVIYGIFFSTHLEEDPAFGVKKE